MPKWITYEPAVWLATGSGIVAASIVLLVSFGVGVTPEQKAAILTLVTLIIPIIGGVATRGQVTPVAKLDDAAKAQAGGPPNA